MVYEQRSLADLWRRRRPIIAEDAGYDPNRDISRARVLDANGMPIKEVPLVTSADRKTLKFPADALYVVLQ